jgi:hypothetical protein
LSGNCEINFLSSWDGPEWPNGYERYFISYSSQDRERILPLVDALEKTGWSVFWDRTIPAGKTWQQFIGSEIKACRSVVVVWTENSVTSDWVEEEAESGKQRRILIPVLLDKVEPPFGFGTIQAANLVAWDGNNSSPTFSRLVADIAAILGPSPAAVKETEERRRLEAESHRKAEEERLGSRKGSDLRKRLDARPKKRTEGASRKREIVQRRKQNNGVWRRKRCVKWRQSVSANRNDNGLKKRPN